MMTLTLTPSALPLKQFLLCCLLLQSRLLIYSSSYCAFHRPLTSCHLPVSMMALPPPSLLRCPNASHRETLTSTLVSNMGKANALQGGPAIAYSSHQFELQKLPPFVSRSRHSIDQWIDVKLLLFEFNVALTEPKMMPTKEDTPLFWLLCKARLGICSQVGCS